MHHLTLHTTLVHRWVNQWLHSTTSTFIFIMSPSPTCMNQTIFCNRTPFLSPIPICCYVRHDYDQSHVHRTHEIKDTACLVGAQLVKWYPGRETVTHITSFLQFPSTKSTHRDLVSSDIRPSHRAVGLNPKPREANFQPHSHAYTYNEEEEDRNLSKDKTNKKWSEDPWSSSPHQPRLYNTSVKHVPIRILRIRNLVKKS